MASISRVHFDAEPIITITTDFGTRDHYVAEMKAAILANCPNARLIDVTHEIARHDLIGGSVVLERAVAAFGPGSVHLAVVDPGVGTRRRLLVVEIAGRVVVVPDNGLVTWAWRRMGGGRAYRIRWRGKISATFHGRDILGPVAGQLAAAAAGRPQRVDRREERVEGNRKPWASVLAQIGERISDPVLLKLFPARKPVRRARIIHIDHFGNAMTNALVVDLPAKCRVWVGKVEIGRVRRTYGDVAPGELLALGGSSGLLEIAVREGSAAEVLGLAVGDVVVIG